MKYVMPKPRIVLRSGKFVLSVSSRELAKLNPEIFHTEDSHDGYAWGRFGIEPFAQDGASKRAWVEHAAIMSFLDAREDGFTMPPKIGHERHSPNAEGRDYFTITEFRTKMLAKGIDIAKSPLFHTSGNECKGLSLNQSVVSKLENLGHSPYPAHGSLIKTRWPKAAWPILEQMMIGSKKSTTTQPELELKQETKSERLQVLIKPSLFDWLKHKSEEIGVSVNELVNRIVDAAKNSQVKESYETVAINDDDGNHIVINNNVEGGINFYLIGNKKEA